MTNKFITWIIIGFLALGVIYVYQDLNINLPFRENKIVQSLFSDLLNNNDNEDNNPSAVDKVKKLVKAPKPLVYKDVFKDSFLTTDGTLDWTNRERRDMGISDLVVNDELMNAAEIKLNDMIINEYFEHTSPDGVTIEDLVNSADYGFLTVGENLAVGTFPNDEELVTAWMNSPGHRENILSESFSEIGIAVGKGQFEGRDVWFAVQEFGLPSSACPLPGDALKAEIEENRTEYDSLQQELANLESELKSLKDNPDEYNRKVATYNDKVRKINDLANKIKSNVAGYNDQVKEANNCINQYTESKE